MSSRKTVPVYQARNAGGAVRKLFAGVRAALKTGDAADAASATWDVEAEPLAGYVPQPGDTMRGTDGVWWRLTTVGALTGGAYPCLCDRVKAGD